MTCVQTLEVSKDAHVRIGGCMVVQWPPVIPAYHAEDNCLTHGAHKPLPDALVSPGPHTVRQ